MGQLCVATDSSRPYYLITSRLRRARMNFRSVVPGEAGIEDCDIVLTTRQEAGRFAGEDAIAIEDLDENPLVMKAQGLARVDWARREPVIRIDPGARIRFAVFYAS